MLLLKQNSSPSEQPNSVHILLAKASHMAKLAVNGARKCTLKKKPCKSYNNGQRLYNPFKRRTENY